MRARIKTLEKKEGVKGSDKLLELPEDKDVAHSEMLRQDKARQQLLTQFRRGALNAGKSGDDFWKRKNAQQAAAMYRMEALNAGQRVSTRWSSSRARCSCKGRKLDGYRQS